MMDELAQRIAHEKDAFLFGLFKKYGYHRAKVMELLHKKRLSVIVHGDYETYLVDDKKLFRIRKIVNFDDENYKVTFSFKEVAIDETD